MCRRRITVCSGAWGQGRRRNDDDAGCGAFSRRRSAYVCDDMCDSDDSIDFGAKIVVDDRDDDDEINDGAESADGAARRNGAAEASRRVIAVTNVASGQHRRQCAFQAERYDEQSGCNADVQRRRANKLVKEKSIGREGHVGIPVTHPQGGVGEDGDPIQRGKEIHERRSKERRPNDAGSDNDADGAAAGSVACIDARDAGDVDNIIKRDGTAPESADEDVCLHTSPKLASEEQI